MSGCDLIGSRRVALTEGGLIVPAFAELLEFDSRLVGGTVPVAVVAPAGFGAGSVSLPLCILLHGGGSDRTMLSSLSEFLGHLWSQDHIAPMVLVCPSTGPMSWYAGPWEAFVADELPSLMSERFNTRTDPAGTVLSGVSMGGFGTLKIGFKNPGRFAALAALEPAILPGLSFSAATPRATFWRIPGMDAALYGDPVDEDLWRYESPAILARANADAIRASGVEIYLEVGDEDNLNLQDGTEYLHRVLWDLDIRHHYQLVRWGAHVGPNLVNIRLPHALRFLSDALAGGLSAPRDIELMADEQAWLDWVAGGMTGEPREMDMTTDRAPAMLDLMNGAERAAAASDPTWSRAYGVLPPTTP